MDAEPQFRSKNAGIRTHALVALGTATFLLVSKFGFNGLIGTTSASIDRSRVAAQIVSDIGFLGGGLTFVRSDVVRWTPLPRLRYAWRPRSTWPQDSV